MIQNEIIEELVLGLNRIIGDKLDCVILYGSVARGEDRNESDVDIAFVVKTSLDDEMKNAFWFDMRRADGFGNINFEGCIIRNIPRSLVFVSNGSAEVNSININIKQR